MPDALATVLRIRRVTVDDARRRLGELLRAEAVALALVHAADAAITKEGQVAADLMAGDGAVEAYAAWLPVGRANVAAACEASERAQSEVAKARAALAVARAAAESADMLLAKRRAETELQAARRSQADTDEVARRVTAPEDR